MSKPQDFARSVKRAARGAGELAAMPGQGHRLAVNHKRPAEAASVRAARSAKVQAGQAQRAQKLLESRKVYERAQTGTPEEITKMKAELEAKIAAHNARIDAARQARREAIEANRPRGSYQKRGKRYRRYAR